MKPVDNRQSTRIVWLEYGLTSLSDHGAGGPAGQPNVVRVKILPIVLVSGVMILGFEIVQQGLAEYYELKKFKLEGCSSGYSTSDLRLRWVPRLYYTSGCSKAVWLIRNPRQVCLRLRFSLFYAVLWFVWANPSGRKIVKSRKQRVDFTGKLIDHLCETFNSIEGQS